MTTTRGSTRSAATGNYGVEYVQGNSLKSDGASNVFFVGGDLAQVEDTVMSAGQPTWFRVVPAAGQDLEMLLMRSTGGNAATYVRPGAPRRRVERRRGRGRRVVQLHRQRLPVRRPGRPQPLGDIGHLHDLPGHDGADRLPSRSTSGRRRRTSVTSPPTCPPATRRRACSQMRVAFDGTLDSEPWVPYSPTLQGVLPNTQRHEDRPGPVPQQRRHRVGGHLRHDRAGPAAEPRRDGDLEPARQHQSGQGTFTRPTRPATPARCRPARRPRPATTSPPTR